MTGTLILVSHFLTVRAENGKKRCNMRQTKMIAITLGARMSCGTFFFKGGF